MNLEEARYADVVVLKLSGRIDQETSPALQTRLTDVIAGLAPDTTGVVIDFGGVPYISSAGLRVLMIGAKQSKTLGKKLAIASLRPVVREVFQISRFDKVIGTYAELHEAIGGMSAQAQSAFNAKYSV